MKTPHNADGSIQNGQTLPPEPKWELVTPELARHLIGMTVGNRPVSINRVKNYARTMLEGKWKYSHHGICIGGNGGCDDGQHRLRAIVQSGVSIWFLVARWPSIENAFQLGCDIGGKRNNAELLRIPAIHASVAGVICDHSDKYRRVEPDDVKVVYDVFKKEIVALYSGCASTAPGASSASVGAAAVVNMKISPENADWVVGQYRKLVLLEEGRCPSIVSLSRLCQDRSATVNDKAHLLAKAFSAFDYKNRNTEKLIIRDLPASLGRVRSAISKCLGTDS